MTRLATCRISRRGMLGFAAGVLAMLAGPLQAADTAFRSADTHGGDYPTVAAVEYMGDLLVERSGGRLDVKVFHSRALGEEKDTIAMVEAGALDIVRTSLAPLNDVVPETRVLSMPFLFRDADHFHTVLSGPIGREILDAFSAHGFIGLAFYDSGARSFYTRETPVRSLADLKGLKIRIQDSDLVAATMRALGAEPVKMPFGQVLTGLLTGIIDGAENNWPSYESTGHFETAGHYTLSRHLMIPEVVVMSKKVWDGLSAEDQALVREAASESQTVMRNLWEARARQSEAAVRAAGVQVYDMEDRDAVRAAVAPVYDQFLTDPRLRSLADRIQAVK